MSNAVKKGSWVEIYKVEIEPKDRSPNIPDDTKKVPLELKVKGFLLSDAKIGDTVEIETYAGRKLSGKLILSNPPYTHKFGQPIPELMTIGLEAKKIIAEAGL